MKCPHCGEEVSLQLGKGLHTGRNSPADYILPRTWEKYAGHSISYVYEKDPEYLHSLLLRTERPIIGKLREVIEDFLDSREGKAPRP